MVEADGVLIFVHVVERGINSIVWTWNIMLRHVIATDSRERARHQWLVFLSWSFTTLHFILWLVVTAYNAIHTLTLTWSLLLIHVLWSWWLVSSLPNISWLLPRSLAGVASSQDTLGVQRWHCYVSSCLSTMIALKKWLWSIKTVLIHLLGSSGSGSCCTRNCRQLLLSARFVVNLRRCHA